MVLFPGPSDIELLTDAPDCGVFVPTPAGTRTKLVVAARDNGDWIALFEGTVLVVEASTSVSIFNLILLVQNLPDRLAEAAKDGFAIGVKEAVCIAESSSKVDGAGSLAADRLGGIEEGS